jgi:hypothetical protein
MHECIDESPSHAGEPENLESRDTVTEGIQRWEVLPVTGEAFGDAKIQVGDMPRMIGATRGRTREPRVAGHGHGRDSTLESPASDWEAFGDAKIQVDDMLHMIGKGRNFSGHT